MSRSLFLQPSYIYFFTVQKFEEQKKVNTQIVAKLVVERSGTWVLESWLCFSSSKPMEIPNGTQFTRGHTYYTEKRFFFSKDGVSPNHLCHPLFFSRQDNSSPSFTHAFLPCATVTSPRLICHSLFVSIHFSLICSRSSLSAYGPRITLPSYSTT